LNARSSSETPHPTLLDAMNAMRRAAVRARELARQTGTHLVLQRGGQVVREKPTAEMDTPAS
jgi:hypothetical protein